MLWFIKYKQNKIKQLCKNAAYTSRFDFEDLYSEISEKLIKFQDKFNGESESQFFAWLHMVIRNTTINYSRSKHITLIDRSEDSLMYSEHLVHNQSSQPDIDLKYMMKDIQHFLETEVYNKRRANLRLCFEGHFLRQYKYEFIAKKYDIRLGTVKTCIHVVRKLIEQRFGERYKLLIQNN